jgi:hypothetical protein
MPSPAAEVPMRAMVYRGPGRIRIEEKEMPAIEHPNDAIVKVTSAAICWRAACGPRQSRRSRLMTIAG